ncbi:acyl-CoA desaturase [Phenylobacterium sp.]|uniref:acyl-CoA desaturase n=1 Tax=Phenylobacterium sp. TaxID=1871053 RepID=UPI0030F3B54B
MTLGEEPHDPFKVNSVRLLPGSNPKHGVVRWSPVRSLWNGSMMAGALVLGPQLFTWGGLAAFLALSAVVLCAGHSVGYHRRLIHRSFKCPKGVERTLVWFGAAVGMGGPLWTIRIHDLRDWAQRQPDCHDFLRHGRGALWDGWWNLHCRLDLDSAPAFDPGPEIAEDQFYRFLERTWMLHQIPIALGLYALGGWSFVVWGVCVRIFTCNTMHWYVGRLCHSEGPQSWLVDDAGVQAHDLPWAAIPTMGESWHNNHHAFPGSARHGLYPGQFDIGFRFIQALGLLGLAHDIQTPDVLPPRPGITPISPKALLGTAAGQASLVH